MRDGGVGVGIGAEVGGVGFSGGPSSNPLTWEEIMIPDQP